MTHAEYMREWRKRHSRGSRAGKRYTVPDGPVYQELARKAWR